MRVFRPAFTRIRHTMMPAATTDGSPGIMVVVASTATAGAVAMSAPEQQQYQQE
ncbi:MAG: hypothetical protein HY668_00255 [Chloroflexi bacterium]|nr:hypothetical protein [Chloroflexota bacterium]